MSNPQPNMSTLPQESTPNEHSHSLPLPLGAAQTALSSLPHPPETSVSTAVTGAAQTPPRLASSSSYHAILVSKPVPEVPKEHMAEKSALTEVPQRVASPSFRAPTSMTHGGGAGANNHSITPPRKAVHVTRSYPTRGDAAHAPWTFIVPPMNSIGAQTATTSTAKRRRQRSVVAA
jgi:hypothetical protein